MELRGATCRWGKLRELLTIPTEPLVRLLAEDDAGHAILVRRNLQRAGVANEVRQVADGQAALDFARRKGAFAGRALNGPLLLLFDINMPILDGVETLRRLKADEATRRIPVIILTTIGDPREIARCYELGCGVYVTKSVEYLDYLPEASERAGTGAPACAMPSVTRSSSSLLAASCSSAAMSLCATARTIRTIP